MYRKWAMYSVGSLKRLSGHKTRPISRDNNASFRELIWDSLGVCGCVRLSYTIESPSSAGIEPLQNHRADSIEIAEQWGTSVKWSFDDVDERSLGLFAQFFFAIICAWSSSALLGIENVRNMQGSVGGMRRCIVGCVGACPTLVGSSWIFYSHFCQCRTVFGASFHSIELNC